MPKLFLVALCLTDCQIWGDTVRQTTAILRFEDIFSTTVLTLNPVPDFSKVILSYYCDAKNLCQISWKLDLHYSRNDNEQLQAYMRKLFSVFFLFFFRPSKKYDNRSRERLNGFSLNFYQTIRGKCSFQRRTEMGARPQIIFWGLKLHIAHLVMTPGEWLRISLLAMALCSYGGCVEKAWRRECI